MSGREPRGSEAAYANYGYRSRWIGYYGVNPRTGIAVTGPHDKRAPCSRAVRKINATEPIAHDLLVVRAIR